MKSTCCVVTRQALLNVTVTSEHTFDQGISDCHVTEAVGFVLLSQTYFDHAHVLTHLPVLQASKPCQASKPEIPHHFCLVDLGLLVESAGCGPNVHRLWSAISYFMSFFCSNAIQPKRVRVHIILFAQILSKYDICLLHYSSLINLNLQSSWLLMQPISAENPDRAKGRRRYPTVQFYSKTCCLRKTNKNCNEFG